MPFWKKFTQARVASAKGVKIQSPIPLAGQARVSLQSFGLALLQHEVSLKRQQNVVLSPVSIFVALAMTENGAAGDTKAAMRRVLALPADINDAEFNQTVVELLHSLHQWGEAELEIANALWIDARATIASEFVRLCQEVYQAAAATLDFSNPASAQAINNWVSDKTKGKIPSIVTAGAIAGLPAVLTNALYFKGKFRTPFPHDATRPAPFYLADGREKLVPMMRKEETSTAYRKGKGFEAAVLSYEGSGISLYLVLPKKGIDPEQFLTEATLQEMLTADKEVDLELCVPRFTIDFDCGLKEPLTRLGMGIAFQNPGADFSALNSQGFFLGEVIHKTYLEVDEEGTVAAAATAVMQEMSALEPEPIEWKSLIFNRPFAVLLRDTTGTILFAGVIYEP